MINTLRKKFVSVSLLSAFVVLLAVLFCANLANYLELNKRADNVIMFIENNKGELPKVNKDKQMEKPPNDFSREALFDTRFFVVYYDDNNIVIDSKMDNIYSANANSAKIYATKIIDSKKEIGTIDGYRYHMTTIDGVSAIIFVDISRDMDMTKKFLYNSAYILLIALTLVALVSYLFSSYAVKPIVSAYEKQKKFITNASHEIKTPLTVISANLDILEMTNEENKWINNSKIQITRLTDLVNSLVALSKMDENNQIEKSKFCISEMFISVAESYNSMALFKVKNYNINIMPNINYTGNSKSISELFYILLDNAFKYCKQDGDIFVEMKSYKGKIYIAISNSVEKMLIGNHDELFDRFYRLDESRNSQISGFGLGLSLAQNIVEKHNGKISAKCNKDNMFIVDIIL